MDIITRAEEAEIHREAYAAIIRGYTRQRGAKRALAERAGIRPEYLSYLLVVDLDPDRIVTTRRRASASAARRIAAALPAPQSERERVLEHMLAARDAADHVERGLHHRQDFAGAVLAVRHTSHRATHAADAAAARVRYRAVVNAGLVIARRMSVRGNPNDYVELCLCLHDALCVLDDAALALAFARRAEIVMEWMDPAYAWDDRQRWSDVQTNVRRAVGVCYSNLGLVREARGHFDRAFATAACVERPRDWIPHVARDRLSVLARTPRFALSEAEALAERALDEMGDTHRELHGLLVQAKLGDCYLSHDRGMVRAGRILEPLAAEAQASSALGPLHRAILYQTVARLWMRRGVTDEVESWLDRALAMAAAGGLENQVRRVTAGRRQWREREAGGPIDSGAHEATDGRAND